MTSRRDPYELETPRRRPADEAAPGRKARQLQARLRRHGAHPKPLGARRPGPARSRFAQRSMVKVSFRKNLGAGQWRAHGRYISRESSRPDPERRGLGFDASREDVPVPATLSAWQKAGDPVLWKLVVSPENGARMDLRRHARDLLGRMERDLGTRLEWVAVEHDHNDHPHLHIVIRGVREDRQRLGLPGAYLRHGIRGRSEALATRELGPRTSRDQVLAREAGVRARHVGALDREIAREAGPEERIAFGRRLAPGSPRHQLWRRLEFLEELGLARREGPRAWRLVGDLEPALRAIQRTRDLQRSLADPEVSLSDARPRVRWTELEPGAELTGRVAGAVLDERTDRAQLLVEGTDGLLHVVPQTPAIERLRGEGGLRAGTIVTLRCRVFDREGERRPWMEVQEHGRLEDLREVPEPTMALDREALQSVPEGGSIGRPGEGRSRFAALWREALQERAELLIRAGLLEADQEREGYMLARGAAPKVDSELQLKPVGGIPGDSEKPVRAVAKLAGQALRGTLRGVTADDGGRRVAVLDTGWHRMAIPTDRKDLMIGREYEARSHYESRADRRRALAWRFEDLERTRERGHQHER